MAECLWAGEVRNKNVMQRQETARAKEKKRAIIRAEEERLAWALESVRYECQARVRAQEQLQDAQKQKQRSQARANKKVKAAIQNNCCNPEQLPILPGGSGSTRKDGRGGAAIGLHQKTLVGRDTRKGAHASLSRLGGPALTPRPGQQHVLNVLTAQAGLAAPPRLQEHAKILGRQTGMAQRKAEELARKGAGHRAQQEAEEARNKARPRASQEPTLPHR